MTLAEIIADHEARRPQPPALDFVPAAVALTPRGDAAVALYRFVHQVRCLDAADRAYVLGLLNQHLVELPTTA